MVIIQNSVWYIHGDTHDFNFVQRNCDVYNSLEEIWLMTITIDYSE